MLSDHDGQLTHARSKARAWPWIIGLSAALATSTGHAATFLYLHYGPTEYRAAASLFITPADGVFRGSRFLGGPSVVALVTPHPASPGTFASVRFGPAAGQPLVPGVYEHATADESSGGPVLSIYTDGFSCGGFPGRFELHELVTNAAGGIVVLSLDFEQDCGPATVRGALRLRTGDFTCTGASDGEPCDDGNPCTQEDSCHAAICEGVDTVSATCSRTEGCAEGGTCDRRTGACQPLERPNGAWCEDGDACTTTGACQVGRCVGADPPVCDDGSICTEDRCEAAIGCVYDPAPGTCLVTRPVVRSVATASADGQSVRCTLHCQSSSIWTLVLYEDATYRSPGGTVTSCPTGASVVFPDEVGTVRQRHGKGAVLAPANLDALLRASEECTGVRPREYRTRISGERDGLPVDITSVTRMRVRARVPVSVTTRSHGRFVPGVGPSGAVVPPLTTRLPLCETSPRPRCVRD